MLLSLFPPWRSLFKSLAEDPRAASILLALSHYAGMVSNDGSVKVQQMSSARVNIFVTSTSIIEGVFGIQGSTEIRAGFRLVNPNAGKQFPIHTTTLIPGNV